MLKVQRAATFVPPFFDAHSFFLARRSFSILPPGLNASTVLLSFCSVLFYTLFHLHQCFFASINSRYIAAAANTRKDGNSTQRADYCANDKGEHNYTRMR